MADALAPPGSSTYTSNSMVVGDGTWDLSRNDFLLPNLQGLNFATMQYNGMGNRFKDDSRYHALIIAHGVVAALVFLFITPLAVFIAKFFHADGDRALRMHVTLQTISMLLLIAVITLGISAVGPERSLTNPHHGIGIAIFALVLLQATGGALIRVTEKGKPRPFHLPLKLMLHKWFGRAIVILGITQVALGLTLYGAPLYLFVLYAAVVFVWLVLLFIFCHRSQGLTAGTPDVIRRFRDRHTPSALYHNRPPPRAPPGQSSPTYPDHDIHNRYYGGGKPPPPIHPGQGYAQANRHHPVRDAALAGGALAGGALAAYHQPYPIANPVVYGVHPGPPVIVYPAQVGLHPVMQLQSPTRSKPRVSFVSPRPSPQSSSVGSSTKSSDDQSSPLQSESTFSSDESHSKGVIGTLAGLTGTAALLKRYRRRRRHRRQRRFDEMYEIDQENAERIHRVDSRRASNELAESQAGLRPVETTFDDILPERQTPSQPEQQHVAPLGSHRPDFPSSLANALVANTVMPQLDEEAKPSSPVRNNHSSLQVSPVRLPPPPLSGPVPRPRVPQGAVERDAIDEQADQHGSVYSGSVSMASVRMAEPPVSVKVRIKNNERQVTMRRLNEAEAAAEQQRRRPRPDSMHAGMEVEQLPFPQQQPPRYSQATRDDGASPVGRYASEGEASAETGTASESSAFGENRRRRRAERAQNET